MIRVAVAALGVSLVLQQPPTPKFRAGVEVVRVDVLVTDGGKPVSGLTAADFELRDSQVSQQIQSAVVADVPVSMLLGLDTSSSVKGDTLAHLKDAAHAAMGELGDADRASLLTFSEAVERHAEWGPPSPSTRSGIDEAEAGGHTSLYDAAFAALMSQDDTPGNRGLILLFSDGVDTASWLPRSAPLEKAKRTDAVVYSVVLGRPSRDTLLYHRSGLETLERYVPTNVQQPFLEELSELTGGRSFESESTGRLREAFARIVTEFRSRYLLTYVPTGVDAGGWHPIEVKLKNRKARVTARRGYLREERVRLIGELVNR